MKSKTSKIWPKTIAEAIHILDVALSDEDKELIKSIPLENLQRLQSSLGTLIVSEFGLHDGNYELITCTLEIDPELAAGTIIREFWDSLHLAPIQQIH
jgi:hypothetical protein